MSAKPPTLYLHVGLHKTGTTSFQRYCWREHRWLLAQGLAVFHWEGEVNVYKLGTSTWRPSTRPLGEAGLPGQLAQQRVWQARLADFAARHPQQNLLVSTEAISHARTEAEMEALKRILPTGYRVHALLVTRDKEAWWASCCNQVRKQGRENFSNPNAPEYLDPEGWLMDWDVLRALLRAHVDELTELPHQSDITPALLAVMGVNAGEGYRPLRENRRVTGWRWALQLQWLRLHQRLAPTYRRYVRHSPIGGAWRRLKRWLRGLRWR